MPQPMIRWDRNPYHQGSTPLDLVGSKPPHHGSNPMNRRDRNPASVGIDTPGLGGIDTPGFEPSEIPKAKITPPAGLEPATYRLTAERSTN